MRAQIHDGPEHMLQWETEYIEASRISYCSAAQKPLHRAAVPYIGSFSTERTGPAYHVMSVSLRAQLQRAMVVFGCCPVIGKYLCFFDQVVAIRFRGRDPRIQFAAQARLYSSG